MNTEELLQQFTQLLVASEGRIDKTNAMIDHFADSAQKMMSLMTEMTTTQKEQFGAIEQSRAVAQDNNTELIRANMEMQTLMTNARDDHREQLASYRKELHSAKDRCNKLEERYVRLEEKYEALMEKYTRLSEGLLHSTPTTDVRINNK